MLYTLFQYLHELGVTGTGVMQYISFRAGLSLVTSLVFATIVGRKIIDRLQFLQVGETIRNLGLEGQMQKKGTPTMGGIIIILSILLPVLLFCRLDNVYVLLMIFSTIWLGMLGFIDDYIKVFKKNKEGLSGWKKIAGQVSLGLVVAAVLYFSHDTDDIPVTVIPFFKGYTFDYRWLVPFAEGELLTQLGWLVFAIVTIFIITATSNGANMTDGLDGLATGTSAIIGTTLGVLAYLSGHHEYAGYLHIMFIQNSGELVVYIAAFIGATIGFLWYNAFPAQVFMGDTGSLTLGGIIAILAIIIHAELLLPILCGIFFVENVSVMMQVSYFKYTKRKYGEGRRIFLMAPIHHHFQKKGYPEPKIVLRFWLIGIILAVVTLVTLKIR
ncbi:MAG: phospho-N-acetylmuramoyl-pentapeptide-transferase [Bacteroidales bacterium]|jgi:phospho-N-acetylmuramoyl-pentapeptide-transferase|nr:phospho-N-acetylmuramoyl-pentapeptide-transferase [Bacteroidales bacterium]MBP5419206.1 phospho-N-acetylmuramoyl-pentapeptide-transferase [Bacteroidales bacterium]MCR5695971.1 phospho-N-acetylmuramoyl-pentapeptide-transferase [Marinilabiliaceae bacterium]